MKRQTTIPAVIAAAALLLSACGGNSDAESNTSTSAGAVSVDDCSDPSGAAAPITDKLTVGVGVGRRPARSPTRSAT